MKKVKGLLSEKKVQEIQKGLEDNMTKCYLKSLQKAKFMAYIKSKSIFLD